MAEPGKTVGSIRFGRFDLSVETGELRKDGIRLKLSGQAVDVLLLLATKPGNLVNREELQQKLWPGASFGDPEHGLNAAVNKLRETLGDSATEPKYIETVPRRGYRFIATLDSPVVAPEPEPPKPEPKRLTLPWWRRKATIAIAACVAAGALLYPWIASPIEKLWRVRELQQLKAVPLTTLPGFVWSPTFSPDGSQIAFAWHDQTYAAGRDLYVKVIGTEKPLRLTHQGEAEVVSSTAWSPDDKDIAFWRDARGDRSGVFLISPLGGPEHKVASANCFCGDGSQLTWSPDGKQLAFLDHPADSPSDFTIRLFMLSLDSMERVPVKTDCNEVLTPAFSPRGDYLAWSCADNMSYVSINLQRLSDRKVIQLLRGVDGVGGLAWSRDGRHIVFSTSYTGGVLWEVALDRPNHTERLPFGHDVTDVAVSPEAKRLAFTQNHLNTNIWRVDLSNPQAPAQKLVASSREQTAPSYSPDGSQIAFMSNRSGNTEIWVSDSDGSNAVQLSSFGVNQTGTPRWSPDGKFIAFDSRPGGEANIYIVNPHGGLPRKLNIDIRGNNVPSWSHDGKWIYFVNGEDVHNSTVWKVPAEGGHAVQIVGYESLYPRESPDGRYVYFVRGGSLWRVGTDGTGEQKVGGMPQMISQGEAWNVFGSGIYFLGYAQKEHPVLGGLLEDKVEIDFFDLNTSKVSRICVLDKSPPVDSWVGGLPVSRDGRWLLVPEVDEFSSDLMLVENWH